MTRGYPEFWVIFLGKMMINIDKAWGRLPWFAPRFSKSNCWHFRLHADRNPRRFVHHCIFFLLLGFYDSCSAAICMLFFPAFSHIISACLIMQANFIFHFNKWNFMCRKVKIGHRKIINLNLEKWHALKKRICHIQEHQSFNLLHDAQMSWMWQSGASLGKLHLESGFWDQETESKSGENQTQAWFQEQSWTAKPKESLVERESEESLHQAKC